MATARIVQERLTGAAGFSLLEVLVALLILSVGLLGVAGLQLGGLRYTQAAYQNSQATAVTEALIERMRSNPQGVQDGAYAGSSVTANQSGLNNPNCGAAGGCNPGELADDDLFEWTNNSLSRLSDSATAAITNNGDTYTITVNWTDTAERDDDGDAVQQTMSTEVGFR